MEVFRGVTRVLLCFFHPRFNEDGISGSHKKLEDLKLELGKGRKHGETTTPIEAELNDFQQPTWPTVEFPWQLAMYVKTADRYSMILNQEMIMLSSVSNNGPNPNG